MDTFVITEEPCEVQLTVITSTVKEPTSSILPIVANTIIVLTVISMIIIIVCTIRREKKFKQA